ncbi:hypothetical protein LguiB_022696 [Lonicera macranthoides]
MLLPPSLSPTAGKKFFADSLTSSPKSSNFLFHSDANVFIEETSDSLRFTVPTDEIGDEIRAHTVEIYPGVTKIVIRGNNVFDLSIHELDLDVWRFRLPEFTSPELASAIYGDGELVVTVPKVVNLDENDGIWGENWNIGAKMKM